MGIHSQSVTEWAAKGINHGRGLSTTVLGVMAGLYHMPDEAIHLVECEFMKRRFMQNKYPAFESMPTTTLKEMTTNRQHDVWANVWSTNEENFCH